MLPNTIQLESLTTSIRNVIQKEDLDPVEKRLLYTVVNETFHKMQAEPSARKFDKQELFDACGIRQEWAKAEAA